jgi:FdhD protein
MSLKAPNMDVTENDDRDNILVENRSRSTLAVQTYRVHSASCEEFADSLAVEEPLEIQLTFGPSHDRQTKPITVTMRTPGNDAELAAGFLLTEGVVEDSAQILRIDNRPMGARMEGHKAGDG